MAFQADDAQLLQRLPHATVDQRADDQRRQHVPVGEDPAGHGAQQDRRDGRGFIGYTLVGIGAAAYSPAKYGILGELTTGDKLVKATTG
jgi:hypothetical protein